MVGVGIGSVETTGVLVSATFVDTGSTPVGLETMGSTEETDEGDSEASEDVTISGTDVEGLSDGIIDEVASVGVAEGVSEGVAEGVSEGVLEGVAEGVSEGVVEGVLEGVLEGVAEAEGVTRVTTEIPETT